MKSFNDYMPNFEFKTLNTKQNNKKCFSSAYIDNDAGIVRRQVSNVKTLTTIDEKRNGHHSPLTFYDKFRVSSIKLSVYVIIMLFLSMVSHSMAMPAKPSILRNKPESNLSRRAFLQHRRMNIKRPDKIAPVKVQGVKKFLVILIKGTDESPSYNTADFQDLLFSHGTHPTGSLRDYFHEVSTDKLDVQGTVVGWYTASNNHSYYINGLSGVDSVYPNNGVKLAEEAIDAAYNAGVNFSQFDNDGDGEVEGVFIVHPGPGAETIETEQQQVNYMWSHKWDLVSGGGSARVYNGVRINNYTMQPEKNEGNDLIEIGVFCHEFGHLLELPEMYDTKYQSYGNGVYDLMSSGAWGGDGRHPETPTHLSAWSKYYLGWADVDSTGIGGEKSLLQVEDGNDILKIDIDGNSKEYFLICNRQKKGFDKYLPGSGLLIWHVDENRIDDNWIYGTINDNPRAQGITLMEADGKDADGFFDMQRHVKQSDSDITAGNRGDAGDFFPGSTNNIAFTPITNPSSDKNNGSKSGISIINISTSSSIMSSTLSSTSAATNVSALPGVFSFPNPFRHKNSNQMVIKFPGNLSSTLKIYNIAGELVRTLDDINRELDITRGEAYWDGKNDEGFLVSSGLYIYILDSSQGKKKGKILFIK